MKKEIDNTVKKALKKLIAEEFLAWQLYIQMIAASKLEESGFAPLFNDLAIDEFDDHYNKLLNFAKIYDCDVPCTNDEYQKYADKKLVKLFNFSIKKNKESIYYIDIALKSEELAIYSYEEILNIDNLDDDFFRLINPIYYEECEHYSRLNTLKIQAECKYI